MICVKNALFDAQLFIPDVQLLAQDEKKLAPDE